MPTLKFEPCVFPDDLLNLTADRDAQRHWWAVHTKPRQEKSLARHLYSNQIPFYLPLVAKNSLYRGRRIKAWHPVFTGYLFLFGTDQERMAALDTKRVVQLIPAPDPAELAFDLRNVDVLIKANVPLTVEGQLSPGKRVRVKGGALMGLEGTILSRRGENRLLIAVRFLQQGVSVMIEDFLVEPI